MSSSDPIFDVMDRWFLHLKGELDGGLDAILHEDCVFLSPVVYSPQVGREISKLYLSAAGNVLPGDAATGKPMDADDRHGNFGYTKKILQGHHAMLEFETTVDGIYVNGVDIITCDDDGMIVEFKVMVRPLQAINAVHAQMQATLEQLADG